eukprot:GHVU01112448.1.p3 GENE.GHVU01112448.1~~GHVU01112448.1.p3  ORF type:complete len:180 (-),score=11.89 GHVU01112448.1:1588-2127(-)
MAIYGIYIVAYRVSCVSARVVSTRFDQHTHKLAYTYARVRLSACGRVCVCVCVSMPIHVQFLGVGRASRRMEWNAHALRSSFHLSSSGGRESAPDGEAEEEEQKDAGYLCTGYTAVLYREPCVMCSMALLHSRIAAVAYRYRNGREGGLASFSRLHLVPGLNHSFNVLECSYDGCIDNG